MTVFPVPGAPVHAGRDAAGSHCPGRDTTGQFHNARSRTFTTWTEGVGLAMAA
jgi:hypothetical protein